jgi:membrane fusion protein (multidrug efflux system)
VTVVTLAPESVQLTRELPGRVRAYLVAEVRPQVNGIIEKRLFTEGGEVKAGQALYQLEDDTYRADLQSARAALQRAKAAVRVARVTANRSRQLVQAGIISKQDHDNNAAALQLAQADEKSAEAAAQRAEVVLQYARITAPISGNIGTSAVTAGALVTANQQSPLALVQQLDPVYVDLTQSSGELLELRRQLAAGSLERQKTPVSILLEDGSTYSHEGQLEFSDVTVDPGTGSFLLRVVVPNPERVLMPGMYVRAVIGRGMRSNALLVPQQGVTRDPKGNATAMVVGKDGKVAVKQVQTSRALGDRWLVEGGLAAGDRVIIEGLQKIRPGIQVRATEATRKEKATGGSGRPGGARQPAGGQAPPARGE